MPKTTVPPFPHGRWTEEDIRDALMLAGLNLGSYSERNLLFAPEGIYRMVPAPGTTDVEVGTFVQVVNNVHPTPPPATPPTPISPPGAPSWMIRTRTAMPPGTVAMPNVIGRHIDEANAANLLPIGLYLDPELCQKRINNAMAEGTIVQTFPKPGEPVETGNPDDLGAIIIAHSADNGKKSLFGKRITTD